MPLLRSWSFGKNGTKDKQRERQAADDWDRDIDHIQAAEPAEAKVAASPAKPSGGRRITRSLSFGSTPAPKAVEPVAAPPTANAAGSTAGSAASSKPVRRASSFTRGVSRKQEQAAPTAAADDVDADNAIPSLGAARLRSLDFSTKKNSIAESELERCASAPCRLCAAR